MIRPGRSARIVASAGAHSDDTEALQTDVMRFMAIIGLCLTAIFALVQSAPARITSTSPVQVELQHTIAEQQQQLRELQAETSAMEQQLNETRARNEQAQQTLHDSEQQLNQVTEANAQARKARRHIQAELNNLHGLLQQAGVKLDAIRQAARAQQETTEILQQRLARRQKKLDDYQQRLQTLRVQQDAVPALAAARQAPNTPPAAKPSVQQQGFSLRFASAEALDRLVANGFVNLYGMSGKKAWRLSLVSGAPAFNPASTPVKFHEMARVTVPAHYLRAWPAHASGTEAGTVTWGVQLPAGTTQRINALTRGNQGGTLVIGAGGDVTIEKNNRE